GPVIIRLIANDATDLYREVVRWIGELDPHPPQVVIQCMIAELDLPGTEEFGVEIGLQSPVMFQRSIFGNSGTTLGVTNPILPAGLTLTGATGAAGQNGFVFNGTNPQLGQNVNAGPGIVGFQGLGNLG